MLLLYTVNRNDITGYTGVIESPDFPNGSPENSNFTWRITVPKGNKINITFSHFNFGKRGIVSLSSGESTNDLGISNSYDNKCTTPFAEVCIRNFADE